MRRVCITIAENVKQNGYLFGDKKMQINLFKKMLKSYHNIALVYHSVWIAIP